MRWHSLKFGLGPVSGFRRKTRDGRIPFVKVCVRRLHFLRPPSQVAAETRAMSAVCRIGTLPARFARGATKLGSRRVASHAKPGRIAIRAMASSFHDFKGKTLGGGTRDDPQVGTDFDFAQLKGKIVLVNNVATM